METIEVEVPYNVLTFAKKLAVDKNISIEQALSHMFVQGLKKQAIDLLRKGVVDLAVYLLGMSDEELQQEMGFTIVSNDSESK